MFQGWRVIHTITCHGDKTLTAMKDLDHSYFCGWGATDDDERKDWGIVNLFIAKGVESGRGRDHRVSDTKQGISCSLVKFPLQCRWLWQYRGDRR
jgi:hypothetical protein